MYIKPTSKAKDGSIFDIHEAAEEFLIYAKNDEIAMPWDADISISGGNVTLEGSISGGSAATPESAGYCKCICSITRFDQWYQIEVPEYIIEENPDLLEAIKEAGWIEA